MTTTTLTAPPAEQGFRGTVQALGTAEEQTHPYGASNPPSEELDAFRGFVDGLLLALSFWLIVALLIAAL